MKKYAFIIAVVVLTLGVFGFAVQDATNATDTPLTQINLDIDDIEIEIVNPADRLDVIVDFDVEFIVARLTSLNTSVVFGAYRTEEIEGVAYTGLSETERASEERFELDSNRFSGTDIRFSEVQINFCDWIAARQSDDFVWSTIINQEGNRVNTPEQFSGAADGFFLEFKISVVAVDSGDPFIIERALLTDTYRIEWDVPEECL